jgi:hypothetical protein
MDLPCSIQSLSPIWWVDAPGQWQRLDHPSSLAKLRHCHRFLRRRRGDWGQDRPPPGGGDGIIRSDDLGWKPMVSRCVYPLVMTNIAIENGHLWWVFPLIAWWFSIAMLNYQRVPHLMCCDSEVQILQRSPLWQWSDSEVSEDWNVKKELMMLMGPSGCYSGRLFWLACSACSLPRLSFQAEASGSRGIPSGKLT